MNRVKILFFATARDKAGLKTLEMEIESGTTIQQLKSLVIQRLPAVQDVIEHCLAAVNHEYSDDATEIPPAAEIAFFPPVSGG